MSVGEAPAGKVSGRGNVRRGCVCRGRVRRGCARRGNVRRGTVRTPRHQMTRLSGAFQN